MCASRRSRRCASTPRACERQYELAERAQLLGWPPQQVVVIDDDLGRSGAEATAREGFKHLVADVGLGKVGIDLGDRGVRLARNNADWYQLLDLCALTDTLIADTDGIYHPGDFNDRLVLGFERHDERGGAAFDPPSPHRRTAAQGSQRRVAPGPAGRVRLRPGRPGSAGPDEAVREAIATVFRRSRSWGRPAR